MTPDDVSRALLRHHRLFALYWVSRVSSTIALQMQAVAVGWQMYDITRNPLDLGLVGLTQFVPAALFVLVAGHVADRYDRCKIVRTCQMVAGLATATLAIGTALGLMTRESLLAIVFVTGSARAFEQTTLSTLLPGIVPLSLLPRATAAGASATQVAVIGGPAAGGLLYAVSPVLVYALCCVLYLTSSIVISLVTTVRTATSREPLSLAVLFAGFRYMRHNPVVLGVITLDLFAVILGGVFALLPVFACDVFHAGPWGLGLLRASPGAGALIAALILARQPPKRRVGRIMFASVATYGVAIIIFALSRSFALSMILLAVLGAADMMSVVIRMTLIQLETPDDMRGRVSSVNSLFVTAIQPAWRLPRRSDGGLARHDSRGDGGRHRGAASRPGRTQGLQRALSGRELRDAALSRNRHRLGHRGPRRRKPMVEEGAEPCLAGVIMQQPALEMRLARLGVRQRHAFVAARRPAAHGGVGDVHVELQRVGSAAVTEGLHRERVSFRQHHRLVRQVKALAVPLIDVVGPFAAHGAAGRRRPDRVIADLGVPVGMLVDPRPEVLRQHLRAEADAEVRLVLLQRDADPFDLALDHRVVIVGALRAAEDHRPGVLVERLRQGVAKARAAHIEREAALLELQADAAGGGKLAVQDDQDRRAHVAHGRKEKIFQKTEANRMPSTPTGLMSECKACGAELACAAGTPVTCGAGDAGCRPSAAAGGGAPAAGQ
jgi:MFS family permease